MPHLTWGVSTQGHWVPPPATLPTAARPHGSTEPAHRSPSVLRTVAHSACQQASCDKPEEPANVSSLRKEPLGGQCH